MIKKHLKLFLLLIFIFVPTVHAKALYIEIVGGQNTGVPIAIVPFTNLDSSKTDNIADIIANDLKSSGQFNVLLAGNVGNIESTADIEPSYWKAKGMEKIVIGDIQKTSFGRYTVNFSLVDLYKQSNATLLSVKFSNQDPENFRALAHHISDLIFEKVVGVRGIFSTRIAYITMDRSAHGKKITYTLTVSDSDGFNDIPLFASNYPIMSPKWSPDAKKIAFVSFEGDRSGISVVDLKTSKVEVISKFPGINGAPAWSPDGMSLAAVLSKDGAPKLYLIDLQRKNHLKQLTFGNSIDTEPFFAPDGNSLFFTSNRGGKAQIYQLDLHGADISRVTFAGDYNTTPSITPDGKKLVMLHKSEDGNFNIATQDLRTGRITILTKAKLDESPSLAPNGMMVLYGFPEMNTSVLGAVTLDGKFKMRLPVHNASVKEPAWSPF
jgi:TolB protein